MYFHLCSRSPRSKHAFMTAHLGVWTLLLEQLNWKEFIKYIKNNWSRPFEGKSSWANTEEVGTKRGSPTESHIRPYWEVPGYKKTFQRLKGQQAQHAAVFVLSPRDAEERPTRQLTWTFWVLLFTGKTTMCSWSWMPLETKGLSTLGRVPCCHESMETVLEVFAQVSVLHTSDTSTPRSSRVVPNM